MIEIDNKAIQQYVYFPKNSNVEADSFDLVLNSQVTQLDYEFTGLTDESNTKNYYKFYLDASQMNDGEFNYSIKANGEVVASGLIKIGEVSDDVPETYNYNPFSDEQSENEIVQYYPTGNYKYRFQNNKIIEVTENGVYNVKPDSGYTALLNVQVNADIIPNKQIKDIEIVENSTVQVHADEGYDALEEVNVTVEVPTQDYWNSGYTSGYTVGYGEGYESGTTDGFESGYTSGYTDGFNTGYTSGCTDGYQEGYGDGFTTGYTSGKTDGIAEQKAKLVATAITANGVYSRENGFNYVEVNIPSGASINNQTKSISISENGSSAITYSAGYTGLERVNLTVNVAQTGYTQQDLDNAYASGMTNGIAAQKAKLVVTGVTSNGIFSREDGFSQVTVNVSGEVKNYNLTVSIISDVLSGLTNNAQVTVTYLAVTDTKTYEGNNLDFSILPGVDYTVSFGEVSGYTRPASISGTTTWNGSGLATGFYQTSSGTPYESQYLTFEILSGGTLSKPNNYTIEYSVNNGAWTNMTTSVTLLTNDTVRLRGTRPGDNIFEGNNNFTGNIVFNAYGNILSILYGDDFINHTVIPYDIKSRHFYELFKRLSIVSAENLILPQNTTNNCYDSMFSACTSLISAPTIPASAVSTQACYYMFRGCTNLVNIPSILPATVLSNQCYQGMFEGCSSITIAPILPASSLTVGCYTALFNKCSSLTTAPVLPATTLTTNCYYKMFSECTSLTTAPELPATTLTEYCYGQMFYGCSNLSYIKCLATSGIDTNNSTTFFTTSVSPTGTFVKASGAAWPSGNNGIPNNWTVQEV